MKEPGNKYLTFTLAEEVYGVPIQMVKEIIGMQGITHIPKTKIYIRGVINLRGKIIPLMDLRLRLGMDEKNYTERTCIIVIDVIANKTARLVGLVVDTVSEVLPILAKNLENPGYETQTGGDFLLHIGKLTDQVVLVLDIEKLVGNDDALVLTMKDKALVSA